MSERSAGTRLTFRGFKGRQVVFKEEVTIPDAEIPDVARAYAEKHCAAAMAGELTMIEIEFMDEPDINQRFCRIGSPDGMVAPIPILPMWTVYKNPSDYPGKFVVRRAASIATPPFALHDRKPLIVCDSLEQARAAIPEGAHNLSRMPGDDPNIYEVWV